MINIFGFSDLNNNWPFVSLRQVQLHVFSMLEGESGNKPGFKKLKEAIGSDPRGLVNGWNL